LNDNESKQKLIDAYARQVREDPTGKQIIEKSYMFFHRKFRNILKQLENQ
jgi:hypothetical protein